MPQKLITTKWRYLDLKKQLMMKKDHIFELAKQKIDSIYKRRSDRVIVLEDTLTEFEFGYYVYYQSKKAVESRKLSDMILGIGPLIIDKDH